MQDIGPSGPETPSPFNRPDRYPRCDALATSWVYIGGRMFLSSDCHAELTRDRQALNLTPARLSPITRAASALRALTSPVLSDPVWLTGIKGK